MRNMFNMYRKRKEWDWYVSKYVVTHKRDDNMYFYPEKKQATGNVARFYVLTLNDCSFISVSFFHLVSICYRIVSIT